MLKLSLYLHIVFAMFWIGGMLFLTLVVAPFLKTIQDPKERSWIYQVVGKAFRFWGWNESIPFLVEIQQRPNVIMQRHVPAAL